ncbi:MAG: DUF1294 domain-containing protein [Peptococcaceae bacterium]|nr:DUF1294 domain-containing protein [Peptococcaceae bacterium]
MTDLIAGYIVAINILGIFLMLLDKLKARSGNWRISEKTLIFIAILGGAPGVYLGLKIFNHKTRHFKFNTIVPAIILIQLLICIYYLYGRN